MEETIIFEDNLIGPKGDKGDKGETGATFTPTVSSNGDLSWVNDKNLPNPNTINIRGPQGLQGVQGERGVEGSQGIQGIKGEKGDPFTYSDFTSEQLESLRGPQGLQGVQGERGIQGEKGDTGVSITTVTSGTIMKDGDYTITPVTFGKSDGSNVVINISAKNGESVSYNDLTDRPDIPSKTSDLINDSGFIDKDVNNLTNYTKIGITYNDKSDETKNLLQKMVNNYFEGKESLNKQYFLNYGSFGTPFDYISCLTYISELQFRFGSLYNTNYLGGAFYAPKFQQFSIVVEINGDNNITKITYRQESIPLTTAYASNNVQGNSGALTTANTNPYTPTSDYHPATKKYVDDRTITTINLTKDASGTITGGTVTLADGTALDVTITTAE